MNNSNNNNGRSQNTISFATSSWGTFSSRFDRQPNYKKSENNAESSLNEQNNITGDVTSQYQSNLEVSDVNNLGNRPGAGGGSFDKNDSNCKDYKISSDSYDNEKSNEHNNDNDDCQQNSNDFGSQQDQMNSNFFGSQQNQANSNNFGSQQNRSNSNNFGSQQNRSNSNNFGSQQNRSNSNNFGSQQNRFNSNNLGSQQYSSNFKNFGSQQNRGNNNTFGSQNRSNSNNFRPRKYQSNSNNMNSSNQVGSWLSGLGRESFGNHSNNGIFQNSNQQNQFNSNDGNNTSSNYVPFQKFRQHFSNRPNDTSNAPPPTLFMGRDQSYPNELNNLMNPFFCGVCNSRLNSIKSANIHYESKAHDKQISNWMKKTFADKGLAVPEVQRFVTEEAIGPYRCELCKVDLTSAQHALQHYNGKRHRQAATKISPPTGIGYYNVDGNWVETGKVMDKVTGKETSYILVNTPSGFEPVVLHVAPIAVAGVKRHAELQANKSEVQPAKKPNIGETHDAEKEKIKRMKEEQYRTMITEYEKNKQQQNTTNSTTNNQFKTVSLESQESSPTGQTPQEALNSQQCKLCGIATTSYDQMLLHLKGARHTKKLRALGEPPISDLFEKSPTTILESLDSNNPSDVSIYRTPSGSYYCKTCNVGVEDIARIKKHISSKAHLAACKKSVEITVKS